MADVSRSLGRHDGRLFIHVSSFLIYIIFIFVADNKIKCRAMVIERTDSEIILRIPTDVDLGDVQRLVDLLKYKEATSKSQATQEDIDRIASEAKKGWWAANRDRFICQ
jgi:hypothetical protein